MKENSLEHLFVEVVKKADYNFIRKIIEGGLTGNFISYFIKDDPSEPKNWDKIGTLFKSAKILVDNIAKKLKVTREDMWQKLKSDWNKLARQEGSIPEFLKAAINNAGGWGVVIDAAKKASADGNYDVLEDLLMVGSLPEINKIIEAFEKASWEAVV